MSLDEILSLDEVTEIKERLYPTSHDMFVQRLEIDLLKAIRWVENSGNWQSKPKEDMLTAHIVTYLKGAQYQVAQDSNSRGHADIVVEKRDYKWLAEAKIFTGSYKWLFKGITQLLNRYTTGRLNENKGALIIYFFDREIDTKMKSWKSSFEKYSGDSRYKDRIRLQNIEDKIDEDLTFASNHKHENTSLNYSVKHFPVIFHHIPLDPDL
jgi:hypothetical protein